MGRLDLLGLFSNFPDFLQTCSQMIVQKIEKNTSEYGGDKTGARPITFALLANSSKWYFNPESE